MLADGAADNVWLSDSHKRHAGRQRARVMSCNRAALGLSEPPSVVQRLAAATPYPFLLLGRNAGPVIDPDPPPNDTDRWRGCSCPCPCSSRLQLEGDWSRTSPQGPSKHNVTIDTPCSARHSRINIVRSPTWTYAPPLRRPARCPVHLSIHTAQSDLRYRCASPLRCTSGKV